MKNTECTAVLVAGINSVKTVYWVDSTTLIPKSYKLFGPPQFKGLSRHEIIKMIVLDFTSLQILNNLSRMSRWFDLSTAGIWTLPCRLLEIWHRHNHCPRRPLHRHTRHTQEAHPSLPARTRHRLIWQIFPEVLLTGHFQVFLVTQDMADLQSTFQTQQTALKSFTHFDNTLISEVTSRSDIKITR